MSGRKTKYEIDARSLHEAVNRRRLESGLEWGQVEARLGISYTTFRRMEEGHGMNANAFVSIIMWLGDPAYYYAMKREKAEPLTTATPTERRGR